MGLKRARYGTSRLRDQENVSYPVSLSPGSVAVPAGLGALFLLGPGCTGERLLLARLLEQTGCIMMSLLQAIADISAFRGAEFLISAIAPGCL